MIGFQTAMPMQMEELLQRTNKLSSKETRLRRELELALGREKDYAKRSAMYKKAIAVLVSSCCWHQCVHACCLSLLACLQHVEHVLTHADHLAHLLTSSLLDCPGPQSQAEFGLSLPARSRGESLSISNLAGGT